MSNLVKQYFVNAGNDEARVINSNQKIEEKLREYELRNQNRLVQPEPDEDGFVQGISAAVLEESDLDSSEYEENGEALEYPDEGEEVLQQQIDIDDVLASARMEADQIIQNAQERADALMEDAFNQSNELFERKRVEGYESGKAQLEEERAALTSQLQEELQMKTEELEESYRRKEEALEGDIVDAIIKVFCKVFNIQFENKREILLHLVKNTLMNVEIGKSFKIHVSQNNFKFINEHLSDIRERVGNDVEIEIVNDANLGSEDCLIETDFGVFDCGIDMELNNLVHDIKSLCS